MTRMKMRRRDWLKTSAGLVATATFTSNAVAEVQRQSSIEFTVISDTHLGYRGGDAGEKAWRKTALELARTNSDFILHLGDIVDGQRVEHYTTYQSIAEPISVPIYEIPGNHDPDDGFRKHVREEVDTIVQHEWLDIILMDNAHTDSHDGFFTEQQLAWLDDACTVAAKAKRAAIICCHVPVHSNKHPDRGWYVKPENGQRQFYEIADRHKDTLIATLHGHFHNGIRGWNDRMSLHEICFPSVLYNQSRGLEEKMAPGYNPNEFRPGYTVVTMSDGKMTLDYWVTGHSSTTSKTLETHLGDD